MWPRTASLWCAVLLIASVRASTYYIAPDGSDSGSGTSSAPFQTLSKALDASQAGDTIVVAGGDYSGSGNTGLSIADRTVTSYGEEGYTQATFLAGEAGAVWKLSGDVELDGLTIDCSAVSSDSTGVQVLDGTLSSTQSSVTACTVGVEANLSATNVSLEYFEVSLGEFGVVTSGTSYNLNALAIRSGTFRCSSRAVRFDTTEITFSNSEGASVSIYECDFYQSGMDFLIDNRTNVEVQNTHFEDCLNTASGGGALVAVTNSTFFMEDCSFVYCSASGGPGGAIYFEGIESHEGEATLQLDDCYFAGCSTSMSGGAVWLQAGHLSGSDNKYEANHAVLEGGAIGGAKDSQASSPLSLSQTDAELKDNTATVGGAVALQGYTVNLSSVVLASNKAKYSGGAASLVNCVSTFDAVSLSRNVAGYDGLGGGLFVVGQGSNSTMSITETLFIGNQCSESGAGAYFQNTTIALEDVGFVNNYCGSSGAGFAANYCAVDGTGASFVSNYASLDGGGYYCVHSTVNLDTVTFKGNTAHTGAAYACGFQCSSTLIGVSNTGNDTVSC